MIGNPLFGHAWLGHQFADSKLLQQALTHRSFGQPNNERLEFLGDSILNCVVAAMLFHRHADLTEGDMSRLRSNLVRQACLAQLAAQWSLTEKLRLGEGELRSGGLKRPSILADTLEAIIGAIYLDAGFEAAKQAIQRLYSDSMSMFDPSSEAKDAKTQLQEWLQARHMNLPDYSLVATEGAAHSQTFEVVCRIAKLDIESTGQGTSRRAAEQSAAQGALQALPKAGPSIKLAKQTKLTKITKPPNSQPKKTKQEKLST